MKRTMAIILAVAGVVAWADVMAVAGDAPAPAGVAAQPPVPGAGPVKLGEGKGQVVLSWDEFVKITGYDPANKSQVITIPWAEVEKLLGVKVENVKGANVDLPWQDFKALLEWSVTKKGEKPEVPPPADYLITSTQYTGSLTADGADFALKVKIDVLRKTGWKRIALLPAAVALTKSTLPDGTFLNATADSYELLTEKSGPLDVTLNFAVAVNKAAGVNRVNFGRVSAGSAVLDLEATPADMDVKVAGAQSQTTQVVGGKTHFLAAIAGGLPVDIAWERALPKVAAVPAKLYAETRTLAGVAEGALMCQEMVNYNILHTGVRELKLTAPAGVSVLEVTGPNVSDWRAGDKGEVQVMLRQEALGAFTLRIAYEAPAAGDTVEIPVLRPDGVEREKGFVGVVALANVEIGAGKVEGATAIDVRQLPLDITAMTNQPTLLGFRYVTNTFKIPLTIKKHAELSVLVTLVDNALYTGMQLNDGRRMTKVIYSVRNNRNQFLRVKLPAGAEIWSCSVGGNTVSPAKDDKGSVLVPLIRSAAGQRELAAFPVELVYVDAPAAVAPASGKVRVDLPGLDSPIMQVMYNYYAPSEGDYTVPEGLFGSKSGFAGNLRLVTNFTSLTAGPGEEVIKRDAAKQVATMQEAMDVRVDTAARAAGAAPIRVQLPVNGKLFRLERILALPQDQLFFEVQYKDWKVAK